MTQRNEVTWCWKSSANRLTGRRVNTDFQFVKKTTKILVSAKHSKGKHSENKVCLYKNYVF